MEKLKSNENSLDRCCIDARPKDARTNHIEAWFPIKPGRYRKHRLSAGAWVPLPFVWNVKLK